ncbi:Periostin [Chionoecetes opilio]|uniref:Periostin n=1 Tax=Chionoecetes opilio TaxID=41210 RepID=A0A8J5CS31_CHIOP|nr:Periostin [Chionoecetes opilio]
MLPEDVHLVPIEVLQMIKCGCASSTPCSSGRCSCVVAQMSCSMFCNCHAGPDSLIQNHVIPHVICESAVTGEHRVSTVSKEKLTFSCDIDGTYLEKTKMRGNFNLGQNGIIHMIDDVLLPDRAKNLLELAESRQLYTFVELVKKAGLEETLSHTGDYTFFVPDEAAWYALDSQVLEKARRDLDLAGQLVRFHGAYGRHLTNAITDNQAIMTLNEEDPVRLQVWRRALGVEDARITEPDLEAQNGVIHIINKVITPSNQSIGDVLRSLPGQGFETFLEAVDRVSQEDEDGALLSLGPGDQMFYTFFVPTDRAFRRVNQIPIQDQEEWYLIATRQSGQLATPRIMASPPALRSSSLILQIPAPFSPLNFATASLTSSREDTVLSMGGSTSTARNPVLLWMCLAAGSAAGQEQRDPRLARCVLERDELLATSHSALEDRLILQGQVKALAAALDNVNVELQQQAMQHSAVQQEHMALLQHYGALQHRHAGLESEHARELQGHARLLRDYLALRGEHVTMEKDLGRMHVTHQVLQESYEALQDKYDVLEAEKSVAVKDHGDLQESYEALQARQSVYEDHLLSAEQEESDRLQNSLQDTVKELQAVQQKNKEPVAALGQREQEAAAKDQALEGMWRGARRLWRAYESLQAQIRALTLQREEEEEDRRRQARREDSLSTTVRALEKREAAGLACRAQTVQEASEQPHTEAQALSMADGSTSHEAKTTSVYSLLGLEDDEAREMDDILGNLEMLRRLRTDEAFTRQVVKQHVAVNMFPETSFEKNLVYTVNGMAEPFDVKKTQSDVLKVNGEEVVSSHLCANGVIHVINKAFMPESSYSTNVQQRVTYTFGQDGVGYPSRSSSSRTYKKTVSSAKRYNGESQDLPGVLQDNVDRLPSRATRRKTAKNGRGGFSSSSFSPTLPPAVATSLSPLPSLTSPTAQDEVEETHLEGTKLEAQEDEAAANTISGSSKDSRTSYDDPESYNKPGLRDGHGSPHRQAEGSYSRLPDERNSSDRAFFSNSTRYANQDRAISKSHDDSSDLRGATTNLERSNTDLRGSATNLRGYDSLSRSSPDQREFSTGLRGTDVSGLTADVKSSSNDVTGSSTDVESSSTNVRGSSTDVRSSNFDLRGASRRVSSPDERNSNAGRRGFSTDIRDTNSERQGSSTDILRGSSTDMLRSSSTDVRGSNADVRESNTRISDSNGSIRGSSTGVRGSSTISSGSSTVLGGFTTDTRGSSSMVGGSRTGLQREVDTGVGGLSAGVGGSSGYTTSSSRTYTYKYSGGTRGLEPRKNQDPYPIPYGSGLPPSTNTPSSLNRDNTAGPETPGSRRFSYVGHGYGQDVVGHTDQQTRVTGPSPLPYHLGTESHGAYGQDVAGIRSLRKGAGNVRALEEASGGSEGVGKSVYKFSKTSHVQQHLQGPHALQPGSSLHSATSGRSSTTIGSVRSSRRRYNITKTSYSYTVPVLHSPLSQPIHSADNKLGSLSPVSAYAFTGDEDMYADGTELAEVKGVGIENIAREEARQHRRRFRKKRHHKRRGGGKGRRRRGRRGRRNKASKKATTPEE